LPKDRRAFLYQQIKAADTKIEPWSSWNQDRWITYAGPVADVNAFAAKLDLGVSRVNGEKRVVLVTMDPAKVPTTPAAEVTDPNDPN
ncbi:MAG: hypothetical protein HUU20_24295, partial [Pirellulales bacterium]|nr:hypothetical protein [Pirellulales bacterium]